MGVVGGYGHGQPQAERAPTKSDTLQDRIKQTGEILGQNLAQADQIAEKLGLPPVAPSTRAEDSPGLHGLAMTLGNDALRLRERLEQINNVLA